MFDNRVLNTLVTLYCDKNLLKQEFICNKVVDPSATLLKIELLFTYISKFWNISALVVSVNIQYQKAWKLTQNPQYTAISWD